VETISKPLIQGTNGWQFTCCVGTDQMQEASILVKLSRKITINFAPRKGPKFINLSMEYQIQTEQPKVMKCIRQQG
jgi:hypothetical protein